MAYSNSQLLSGPTPTGLPTQLSPMLFETPVPLDTNLQMIYFLWIRGFIPNAVIENDPLLLKTINDIRNKDYNKDRHDLILERSLPHKVEQNGDRESWDCFGDLKDSKPFLCLFKLNGPIQLTWGDCTKMGEKCP